MSEQTILPPQTTHTTLPQQWVTGTNTTPTPAINYQPPGRYFTEEEVAAIRQQEKDKMYQRLEKSEQQLTEFKTQVESLMADKKTRDEEITKRQVEADKEAERLKNENKSVQELLEQQRSEFQTQQQRLQEDWDMKLAVMEQEQKLQSLKAYIQRRTMEEVNATTIIPDLVEYIDGKNEEEVEASIKKAQEKTAAIVNAAMGSTTPSTPMGTSPTGTPFSPLDNLSPNNRQLTPEQIRNMPMDQWRQHRQQLGISRAGSGQGLFS
jgi:myosin heavy subunit